jgi:hypothetical protein
MHRKPRLHAESYIGRTSESTRAIVRYIVNNPVRAGLVTDPADYPHWGSSRYSREEMLEYIGDGRP